MVKSIFKFTCSLYEKEESVYDIASSLTALVKQLSIVDGDFQNAFFVKGDFKIPILCKEDNYELSNQSLAEAILLVFQDDIEVNNEIVDPGVHFKRDEGFRILVDILTNEGYHKLSLTGLLGSKEYQEIHLEHFNRTIEYDFDWYFEVLKVLVESLLPKYAVVTMVNSAYLDMVKSIGIWPPIGWISYFSNEYQDDFSDKMKGLEIVDSDFGKYYILSRENITLNAVVFNEEVLKIKNIMSSLPDSYTQKKPKPRS